MDKTELIRWGAIDFEHNICFDNLTTDEFLEANGKSPALGFSDAYDWLINAPIEVINEHYGEEMIATFEYSEEAVEEVKTKVEKTLLENKNSVELEKMFKPN